MEAATTAPATTPSGEAPRPVVLVVDDTPLNLKVATDILRPHYRALAVTDGQKALDLAAQRDDLSLILLDVMMPGLDGYDVCRRLKARPETAHIPVIFLTTLSRPEDEAAAFAAGGVDFITKPFQPPTLLARVAAHVRLHQQERDLARERARAEGLLLSILPAPIAGRLKASRAPIAEGFGGVSVIFVDIVGFTTMAHAMPPARTVELLNEIFHAFDRIALAEGVEKIKTIGDAYMAAAGVPEPDPAHARAAARAALAMRAAAQTFSDPAGRPLMVRTGIASGAAVAGVIGAHRFAYDLWGDTVNTAARMESHGLPGRVQVTEPVMRALADDPDFVFTPRGEIDIKGLGPMPTWWLEATAP